MTGIKAQRDPCGDRSQEVNDSQTENRQHGPKCFAHEIRSIAEKSDGVVPRRSRRLCFAELEA